MEVIGTYDPLPRTPLATADGPEDDSSASNSQENNQVHSEGQHRQQQSNDPVTGLPRTRRKYKDIRLDQSRTKYWLGVGAQPSEPVERLLCMVRIRSLFQGKCSSFPFFFFGRYLAAQHLVLLRYSCGFIFKTPSSLLPLIFLSFPLLFPFISDICRQIGLMPPRPGKSRASNQVYFPSAPVSRSK